MEERKGPSSGEQEQKPIRTVIDRNAQGAANQAQLAKGKNAVYLGINCEADPDYQRKLDQLFQSAFKQAGESTELLTTFKKMMQQQQPYSPWKFPNSHHVTTLFIGGNRAKLQTPQAEFHQEGKQVDVKIRAVIYVPEKLVAGICFPDCEIENEFPHMTLMVSSGWAPVLSNAVIKATCGP